MVNSHPIAPSYGELSPHRSFSHGELSPHRSFSWWTLTPLLFLVVNSHPIALFSWWTLTPSLILLVNSHPTVPSHDELLHCSTFTYFILLLCYLLCCLFVCLFVFFFVTPSEVIFDTVSQLLFRFEKYHLWDSIKTAKKCQWHASAPLVIARGWITSLHPNNRAANKCTSLMLTIYSH